MSHLTTLGLSHWKLYKSLNHGLLERSLKNWCLCSVPCGRCFVIHTWRSRAILSWSNLAEAHSWKVSGLQPHRAMLTLLVLPFCSKVTLGGVNFFLLLFQGNFFPSEKSFMLSFSAHTFILIWIKCLSSTGIKWYLFFSKIHEQGKGFITLPLCLLLSAFYKWGNVMQLGSKHAAGKSQEKRGQRQSSRRHFVVHGHSS